jgi:hypothetical protein
MGCGLRDNEENACFGHRLGIVRGIIENILMVYQQTSTRARNGLNRALDR